MEKLKYLTGPGIVPGTFGSLRQTKSRDIYQTAISFFFFFLSNYDLFCQIMTFSNVDMFCGMVVFFFFFVFFSLFLFFFFFLRKYLCFTYTV